MADKVQVQYDGLAQLAVETRRQAETMEALYRKISAQSEVLAASWVGEGAKAYQDEMKELLLPAYERLYRGLEEAGGTITGISARMRAAEDEAAGRIPKGTSEAQSGYIEWLHGALDVVGLWPGSIVGEAADAINAVIYLMEGRLAEAGISAASVFIVGDFLKGGKWAVKGGKEIAEAAAEKGAKEIAGGVAELAAKYKDEGRRIVELYGEKTGGEILGAYDEVADVPGARGWLNELLAKDTTTQGTLSEIGYAASLRRQGFEIQEVRPIIDGKKGPDIVVKGGPVINVKDINWTSPTYKKDFIVKMEIEKTVENVRRHARDYPGHPVEVAFTDLKSVPPEMVRRLLQEGARVTQVTW